MANEKRQEQGQPTNAGERAKLPPGVKLLRTLEGRGARVWSVAFDPQGRTLASGSDDATVRLWDVGGGKLLRTLEGHMGLVYSVAFDPQGWMLASGSQDQRVKLWEAGRGELLRTLEGHRGSVFSVAFDPQGPDAGQRREWGQYGDALGAAQRHAAPRARRTPGPGL